MSVLRSIIKRFAVRNTHHFIAFKATELLEEDWRKILLKHFDSLLKGSKDPDDKLHDWYNHILHPPHYGGAPARVENLMNELVSLLKAKKFKDATYVCGLISHYASDVLHPLHTGQTKEETKIHKFHEFGTTKKREQYDEYINPKSPEFIDNPKQFIIELGNHSHKYYYDVIENYDPSRGFQFHWDLGINERLDKINIELLTKAVWATASLWKTAIIWSGVKPPRVSLSLVTIISLLKTPIYFIRKWLENRYMKKTTKNMIREYRETGKIYYSLPPDDKGLVDIFSEFKKKGILRMRKPAERKEELKETVKEHLMKPRLRYLQLNDPIEDAPEIGKRTGEKLRRLGIKTIKDLLEANSEELAKKLRDKRITEKDIARWQAETKLMVEIPNLHVRDAIYLFHAGVRGKDDLLSMDPEEILRKINEFINTEEGRRLSRYYKPPSSKRINEIIELTRTAQ